MTTQRFLVEAGHIMMFARAIGDPNPIYYDEAYAHKADIGRIIAPPTFIQAAEHFDPEYDRRPKWGEPWFGSGREAIGASGGPQPGEGQSGFHAEQRFRYHRNIHPGDVLAVRTRPGRAWEREGRRGGKLIFTETVTDYVDQRDQPVVSACFVGVGTERLVKETGQKGAAQSGTESTRSAHAAAKPTSAFTAASVEVGQRFGEVVVDNLTRTQLVMYAGASGDFHPFHHDEVYAQAMGQPTIFAPGMLTMALAGKLLTDLVGDGRLTEFGASFRGQVWPGDTLTAYASISEVENEGDAVTLSLTLSLENQHSQRILTGDARARLSSQPSSTGSFCATTPSGESHA